MCLSHGDGGVGAFVYSQILIKELSEGEEKLVAIACVYARGSGILLSIFAITLQRNNDQALLGRITRAI